MESALTKLPGPPISHYEWRIIADDFYEQWGLPDKVGAIDGKNLGDITHRNFIPETSSNMRYSKLENMDDITVGYRSYWDKYL